jgi:hypothetical protein
MNKRLVIYIACILLLEWFSLVNAFVVDLKGASIDAAKFHDAAVAWTHFGSFGFAIDSAFYSQLLGFLYLLFGRSEFVGAQLSVVALGVGAVYFERVLALFRVERTYWWVIPFLLWPSLVTRGTTTMREPLLICLTVLIVYNLLRFQQDRRQAHAVWAIAACLGAALFHKAYAVVTLAIVPYVLFFVMQQEGRFYRSGVFYARLGLGVLFAAMLFVVYRDFSNIRGLEPALALMSGDVEYMQAVVESKTGKAARATYSVGLDFSSVGAIFASYPLVFVYYVFSPFPWMVSSAYDAYAALEGAFRLFGFLCFAAAYRKAAIDRRSLRLVFVVLLAILAVWAAGTVNYGTASRHHTTTIWFFLLFFALALRKETVTACRLLAARA